MMLGAMLGTAHALAIAKAEGVLDRFAQISPDLAALIPMTSPTGSSWSVPRIRRPAGVGGYLARGG